MQQLYKGYYICPCGKVYSCKSNKFLKPYITKDGYLKLQLCIDGITIKKLVHRLVAEVWLENPNNLPIVNHKDENKKNNTLNNLEWCTIAYNIAYSNNKKVLNLDTTEVYESLSAAAEALGISIGACSKIARGKRPNSQYHLKYINKKEN